MRLPPNQLHRFYRGGERIDALRGAVGGHNPGPEDWVGSTTTTLGSSTEGLSRLENGRLVRDLVREHPKAVLGPAHTARWGADPALLVKLLDAGERLPVHFHPGHRFARSHLGARFGKTEAWVILEAEAEASVYAGLRAPVELQTVKDWIADQDTDAMLGALHEIPVRPGDVVFVPAGNLHAIGAGILLVELQEPTDLSVLLEFDRFGVSDGSEHLGLGWELALTALKLEPPRRDQFAVGADGEQASTVANLLPESAGPYFRAQRIRPGRDSAALEQSFASLVVAAGRGGLRAEAGGELALRRGDCVLVPYASGGTEVTGDLDLIRCLPPDPEVGAGQW